MPGLMLMLNKISLTFEYLIAYLSSRLYAVVGFNQ